MAVRSGDRRVLEQVSPGDASVAATPRPTAASGKPRYDWARAIGALRRLFKNKEDTAEVFEIMFALNGRAYAEDYARLLQTSEGGRIAYERIEFAERLLESEWVESFPPGSVGAAYREFQAAEHLSMGGLIEESHKALPAEELDQRHPYAWWFRRIRDLHDVWHVLTGYGRDALGEMCLAAFAYQEVRGAGWALIVTGGFLRCHGPAAGAARRAMLEARARAMRAAWLPGEDYEQLMFEPLEAARARLRLTPPRAYLAVAPALRNLTII
jgi:ubiquinone biosynthesis protein COQ4